MDKNTLRTKAKNIRKELDIDKISYNLVSQIRQSEIYKNAQNVMLYYPTKYEINLLSLIQDDKNFYLPRVKEQNIEVCSYSNNLIKSDLGILEPTTKPIEPNILDLIIVPALMCDLKKYRLGYGGGYYDRFLKRIKCNTICAIPKELYIYELPKEEFDIPIDKIFVSD